MYMRIKYISIDINYIICVYLRMLGINILYSIRIYQVDSLESKSRMSWATAP